MMDRIERELHRDLGLGEDVRVEFNRDPILTRRGRLFEVFVPGIPPGGNQLHRMDHWQVRKSREEWQETTMLALAGLDGSAFSGAAIKQCHVTATWRFRIRRERDFDNLFAGLKPILDALVLARVIEGDSTDHILSLGGDVEFVGKTGVAGVLVRVEEVPGR